jgi:hypothetical protein
MTTIYDQFPQFRRADANQNDAMAHRKKKKKKTGEGRKKYDANTEICRTHTQWVFESTLWEKKIKKKKSKAHDESELLNERDFGGRHRFYLRLPRPLSTTRLLVPTEPMSLTLRTLGKERMEAVSLISWCSVTSWLRATPSGKGGGLVELERRVLLRTSSTQASPSGLIDT